MKIQVSAEHWQFFAFVFAALLTLAYAVLDALLPGIGIAWCWGCTISLRFFVFALLALLTLWHWPSKEFLIWLLPTIKTKT